MILNCLPYGSADYTLLQTIDAGSGTSQISINVSAYTGYNALVLFLDSVSMPANQHLRMRFNNNASLVYNGTNDSFIISDQQSAAHFCSGSINIFNSHSTGSANLKSIDSYFIRSITSGMLGYQTGAWFNDYATAISSIQLFISGGSFSSNVKARLYGVK